MSRRARAGASRGSVLLSFLGCTCVAGRGTMVFDENKAPGSQLERFIIPSKPKVMRHRCVAVKKYESLMDNFAVGCILTMDELTSYYCFVRYLGCSCCCVTAPAK